MAAQAPMHLTVSPNNASTYLKKDIDIKNLKDSYQTVIRFDNNSFYIFVMQGNKLYVESSGKDYGYVYEDTRDTIYENVTAWQAYIKSMKVFVSEQVNPAT